MAAFSADDPITACLSIMRRMPPNKIEQNLSGLLNLVPDSTDELLQRVDQPLEEGTCSASGKKYLMCDYNRDGDSYRSPWSNQYDPPLDDGFVPSEQLRNMEIQANELFDSYRELYFEGGTSSVYLWDLDGAGFAGCFLVKKSIESTGVVKAGSWNSIHVIEVSEQDGGKKASYKLTTTVLLSADVDKPECGSTDLSGSLTRQKARTCEINAEHTHLSNMGEIIEDMETEMRSNMNALYVQKTREIVNSIRSMATGPKQEADFVNSLNAAVMAHGDTRTKDSES
uniref:F-actin-capping protein subunit beta n=1 Tax=Phaeomonas parva TaxID=124430 RepID=A0A6U4L9K2_9STRA|mmetsp:Transcript_6240/g.17449  ORF Transcript_6240/g.17449 Transcript_6240/m.17449 type:complete len:284 (+) Transcript_6240:179-1030(+)